jgi:hypothetical protein
VLASPIQIIMLEPTNSLVFNEKHIYAILFNKQKDHTGIKKYSRDYRRPVCDTSVIFYLVDEIAHV